MNDDDKTIDMFGDQSFDWRKEWQGMPDFEQDDLKAIHQVLVSFVTVEDMNAFSELIGKRIAFTTKSVLFPVKTNVEKKVWIDEQA